MSIFLTSDLHLGHRNILLHQPNRSQYFQTIEEHDNGLIDNWNRLVSPRDTVYLIGDVSFHKPLITHRLLNQLNGIIHLIPGNHDELKIMKNSGRFASIQEKLEIKLDNIQVTMNHYSQRVWRNHQHGSLHVYGHSHGSLAGIGRSMDVGVDCNDLKPATFFLG